MTQIEDRMAKASESYRRTLEKHSDWSPTEIERLLMAFENGFVEGFVAGQEAMIKRESATAERK